MNFTRIKHFSEKKLHQKKEATRAIFIIGVRTNNGIINNMREIQQWIDKDDAPYDLYFVADDDGQPLDHPEFNIMQVSKMECSASGYQHMIMTNGTVPNNAHVCGWDKTLYIISKLRSYDHYWLIEDDVWMNKIDALSTVDNKTLEYDMVCKELSMSLGHFPFVEELIHDNWRLNLNNGTADRITWGGDFSSMYEYDRAKKMWSKDFYGAIELYKQTNARPSPTQKWFYPNPHFQTLACAIRVSRRVINDINKFVDDNQTLFMQEWIFSTMAYHNNYKVLMNQNEGQLRVLNRLSGDMKKYTNYSGAKDVLGYNLYHMEYESTTLSQELESHQCIDTRARILYEHIIKWTGDPKNPIIFHPVKCTDIHTRAREIILSKT